MIDDTRYILDVILADWHQWAKGFKIVASHGACAMFSNVKSSRQWDSEGEVTDGNLHNSQMKAVDFNINELCPLHRTAIGIQARNLVTGRSVWTSARLPTDIQKRAIILQDARTILINRLTAAGVL